MPFANSLPFYTFSAPPPVRVMGDPMSFHFCRTRLQRHNSGLDILGLVCLFVVVCVFVIQNLVASQALDARTPCPPTVS